MCAGQGAWICAYERLRDIVPLEGSIHLPAFCRYMSNEECVLWFSRSGQTPHLEHWSHLVMEQAALVSRLIFANPGRPNDPHSGPSSFTVILTFQQWVIRRSFQLIMCCSP